jgi:hypothetical protein
MTGVIPAKKKRLSGQSIYLILVMISNLISGLYYFISGSRISQALPNVPEWIIPMMGCIGLANFAFCIAIWKWKKWGVYGIITSAVIAFIINLVYLGFQAAVPGLIGIVILLAIVFSLWKQME